jgi:hypothetical protein
LRERQKVGHRETNDKSKGEKEREH